MRSWLADAIAPVHVVVNGSGVERYNLTLNQALAIYPPLDPKVGWTVFYGTNRVTRFFASTMMQLVKGNFSFFGSYEETLAFLVRTDQTLEAFQSELAQV